MNEDILKTGVQLFIEKNWNTDIVSVLLKKPLFQGVSQKELAEQLEAKKKSRDKLPTWFNTPKIYYPNKLNIEQTSSEITAKYKAGLVYGKSLLDLTGGLGIDTFYFSKKVESVDYCELDDKLAEIAAHNFQVLGAKNISCTPANGIYFLQESLSSFDWVYVDPSRRDDLKGKVFRLEDCHPNLPKYLNSIFEKTNRILLKSAPLLDIQQGISELRFVKEIHVVAVNGEVKELLWILEKGFNGKIMIHTINSKKSKDEIFEFQIDREKDAEVEFGMPEEFLYEPNSAILKAGAFKLVSERFGLNKIAPNSHLYTSQKLIAFPGRRFRIESAIPYNKKTLKKIGSKKANITTRNFPESVAEIRKKFKIQDGGDTYLFFTMDLENQKIVLKCKKA